MKIAVWGNQSYRDVLKAKPVNVGIEWVWIDDIQQLSDIEASALFYFDDREELEKLSLPENFTGIVVWGSVVHSLQTIKEQVLTGERVIIRLNHWPGFLAREMAEIAVSAADSVAAADFFASLGWTYQTAPDIPGMVSARVVAMIVNEAYYALGEGVSTKTEIDIAMKLGTNYPFGPFEWSEKIGLWRIYHLLHILIRQDMRYTPAPALATAIKQGG